MKTCHYHYASCENWCPVRTTESFKCFFLIYTHKYTRRHTHTHTQTHAYTYRIYAHTQRCTQIAKRYGQKHIIVGQSLWRFSIWNVPPFGSPRQYLCACVCVRHVCVCLSLNMCIVYYFVVTECVLIRTSERDKRTWCAMCSALLYSWMFTSHIYKCVRVNGLALTWEHPYIHPRPYRHLQY